MPDEKGIFTQEDTDQQFSFSYRLAQFFGQYFDKKTRVIDLGCGRGTYLRYLHDIGFELLKGVEGMQLTNFEVGVVEVQDLTEHFDLGVSGNIICLEVGEHIPESKLIKLFDNITRHTQKRGKVILSWAIPNQDGLGHISCRHNIWVINEMEKSGFTFLAEDSLTARGVIEDHQCEWFRNTIMIFKK